MYWLFYQHNQYRPVHSPFLYFHCVAGERDSVLSGWGRRRNLTQSKSVHTYSNSRGDCLIRSGHYNPIPLGLADPLLVSWITFCTVDRKQQQQQQQSANGLTKPGYTFWEPFFVVRFKSDEHPLRSALAWLIYVRAVIESLCDSRDHETHKPREPPFKPWPF